MGSYFSRTSLPAPPSPISTVPDSLPSENGKQIEQVTGKKRASVARGRKRKSVADKDTDQSDVSRPVRRRTSVLPIDDVPVVKVTKKKVSPSREPAIKLSRKTPKNEKELYALVRFEDFDLECDVCQKHFSSHAKLICHNPCYYRRKGMTVEPVQWTCTEKSCHKFFNTINLLSQHMAAHFDYNFSCPFCAFKSYRRNLVVKHILKTHMSEV